MRMRGSSCGFVPFVCVVRERERERGGDEEIWKMPYKFETAFDALGVFEGID